MLPATRRRNAEVLEVEYVGVVAKNRLGSTEKKVYKDLLQAPSTGPQGPYWYSSGQLLS